MVIYTLNQIKAKEVYFKKIKGKKLLISNLCTDAVKDLSYIVDAVLYTEFIPKGLVSALDSLIDYYDKLVDDEDYIQHDNLSFWFIDAGHGIINNDLNKKMIGDDK